MYRQILASVSNEIDETPVETARAEDPFDKAVFFTELAEAVPAGGSQFHLRSG